MVINHRRELFFRLPPWVDFLEAFPPANSAFSVRLARCFFCSLFLASLVSYRIFLSLGFVRLAGF